MIPREVFEFTQLEKMRKGLAAKEAELTRLVCKRLGVAPGRIAANWTDLTWETEAEAEAAEKVT